MSIKIATIKDYIMKTYGDFGDETYAHYWNLGFLWGYKKANGIDEREFSKLCVYNDKLRDAEIIKKAHRDIEIKKENGKMKIEGIIKRIDGDIRKCQIITSPINSVNLTAEMTDMIAERHKALEIYKEMITRMGKINNPVFDWHIIVRELEEKYYPNPKPKTTKQNLNELINRYSLLTRFDSCNIMKELIEIRDEIGEERRTEKCI